MFWLFSGKLHMRRTTCVCFIIQASSGIKHIEVPFIQFLTLVRGLYHPISLVLIWSHQMFEQLSKDIEREEYLQLLKNSPHPNVVTAKRVVTMVQHVKTQLRCTQLTKLILQLPPFLHNKPLTLQITNLFKTCNFLMVQFSNSRASKFFFF